VADIHTSSFARLAKLIVSLCSSEDTDALQTSPQELTLELIDKYSHFTYYPSKAQTNGMNDHISHTSGKVMRTT
jgi:hypothetical protein